MLVGNASEDEDLIEKQFDEYMDQLNKEEEEQEEDNTPLEKRGIDKVINYVKTNFSTILIYFVYVITALRVVMDIIFFVRGVVTVRYDAVIRNLAYYMLSTIIPFAAWLYSTRQKMKKFRYSFIKIAGLTLSIVSFNAVILNILYLCCCMFLVPLILKIPVSQDVTASMIVNLARITVLLIPGITAVVSTKSSLDIVFKKETLPMIEKFMVDRNIDTRKHKERMYDYSVARDAKTGAIYNVMEDTRKYHMLIVGPTGTGKTSMALTTAIADDMDKRTKNENKQKKAVEKLLKSGEIILTKDIKDNEFDRKWFRATNEKAKNKLNDIFKNYPLCGATIVAPNESFGDEVYEICKARKITKINRVDPLLKDGKHKEGFIGFNPFYISPDLSEQDKKLEIVYKARVFADVLQLLYESLGTKDAYFSGLNKQITSNLCTIIMKGYPLLHEKYPDKYPREQACPQQFLDVVNEFSFAKDYVEIVEDYIRNHPEERRNYENKIRTIRRDMLGDGAKTMREQARGLVNIISDLLDNPLVRDVLCAEKSIDIDKSLAENYVNIINYELSLGDSDSKGFGMFFLLSFQTAVFRRPKNNRPLHMLYIDEFPVLLHPSMSKIFSLYRQYCICAAVAIQNFSQFDIQDSTKFMKNVVLNNARTHIIFGGLGPEEMEYYEKLGGKDIAVTEQKTVSETALSLEDAQLSYSSRETLGKEETFNGRELRSKDFQSATMVTVEKGNVKDAFPIMLDFLSDKQKKGVQPERIDWHQYYNEESADGTEIIKDNKRKKLINSSDVIKNVQTSMTAMVNSSNIGYVVKNESITEKNIVAGLELDKGATVINENKTREEIIGKMKEDMAAHRDDEIAGKSAEIKVQPNEKLTEQHKARYINNLGLDFDICYDPSSEESHNEESAVTDTQENSKEDEKTDAAEENNKETGSSMLDVDLDNLLNKLGRD